MITAHVILEAHLQCTAKRDELHHKEWCVISFQEEETAADVRLLCDNKYNDGNPFR